MTKVVRDLSTFEIFQFSLVFCYNLVELKIFVDISAVLTV